MPQKFRVLKDGVFLKKNERIGGSKRLVPIPVPIGSIVELTENVDVYIHFNQVERVSPETAVTFTLLMTGK